MAQESLHVVRERLTEFLSRLSVQAKNEGKSGLNNIHKLSEPVIRNLMNALYGFDLTLEKKVNAGGFDLRDPGNNVLVQVTGNCTDRKIAECLRTTADRVAAEQELKNTELYIAFLTYDTEELNKLRKKTAAKLKKGELEAKGFRFTAESGILCLQDFVQFLTDDLGPDGECLTAEQLLQIQNLLDKCAPEFQPEKPGLHLPFSVLGDHTFVGRADRLKELGKKLLQGGNDPIVVCGLGGMGKTTLVNRFCADYTGGKVYFVRFCESFTRTLSEGVAAGIPGYKNRRPDPKRDYAEAMSLLHQCGKEDILVIDNADEPNDDFSKLQTDPAWWELRKLKLRLILTTRCPVPGAVQVEKMDNQTLYRFFENQGLTLDTQQMDQLINSVHGHTMTVDLIARTLNRTRTLTPEKLLSALQEGSLPDQNYRTVALERNGEVTQDVIYAHLRQLFNIAEISKHAKDTLRDMILLPEGGLNLEILESVMTDVGLELLNHLIDLGWLLFDQDRQSVSIHPLIRMVCRTELTPDDNSCGELLWAIWDLYVSKQYVVSDFYQFAELFSNAADLLPDLEADWAINAGSLWNEWLQPEKALRYNLKAAHRLEDSMPGSRKLATAYNNLGVTYSGMDNRDAALEYALKAIKIRQQILPADHPDLAQSYSNVGLTYSALGKHALSLEYLMKAVAIFEKALPPDLPSLATAYNNVGGICGVLEMYDKELEYQLKAFHICERTLPADHPTLAISCYNLMVDYLRQSDYEHALMYGKRAAAIAARSLPDGHPQREQIQQSVDALENML